MNNLLLSLINANKKAFKVSFSISGSALEQFEMYTPEVIESFKQLAKTGCVEFVAETDAHSLISTIDKEEFAIQAQANAEKIKALFGQQPKVFKNTGFVYSDELGEQVYNLGFQGILAEGADQVLGWKSPNFLYCCDKQPRLKILLRNFKLTDDVALRFSRQTWSEWPLTADKYTAWILKSLEAEELVNLFFDYTTFGVYNRAESGIFDFFTAFVSMIAANKNVTFVTPSEAIKNLQPISILSVPQYTSCADEERDLSAWLGNNLQKQAFDTLSSLHRLVRAVNDDKLNTDWNRLQASENFHYMSTKFFNHEAGFSPYQTPYEAFINFMNVVSDFAERLNKVPTGTKFGTLTNAELDVEIAKHTEILKELENAKKKQKEAKPTEKKSAKKESKTKEPKEVKTKSTKKSSTTVKEKTVAKKTTKTTTKKIKK